MNQVVAPQGYLQAPMFHRGGDKNIIMRGTFRCEAGPLLLKPIHASRRYCEYSVYESHELAPTGLKISDELPSHHDYPVVLLPGNHLFRVDLDGVHSLGRDARLLLTFTLVWAGRLARREVQDYVMQDIVTDILFTLFRYGLSEWRDVLKPHVPKTWEWADEETTA